MADQSVALNPRKLPTQRRSQAVVEAILDASIRILDEEGYAVFNTNRIAEVAGVSIGSLYQYFPSKEAILMSIITQKRTKLLENLQSAGAACEGLEIEPSLAMLIGAAIKSQGAWPRMAKTLSLVEHELPIGQTEVELKIQIAKVISQVLSRHKIDMAEEAARDIMHITEALIFSAQDVHDPALARNILNAVKGYLNI